MMACCWKYPIYSLFLCRPPPVNTLEMEHQQMRGMYIDHLEFRGSPLTGLTASIWIIWWGYWRVSKTPSPDFNGHLGLFAANSTTIWGNMYSWVYLLIDGSITFNPNPLMVPLRWFNPHLAKSSSSGVAAPWRNGTGDRWVWSGRKVAVFKGDMKIIQRLVQRCS